MHAAASQVSIDARQRRAHVDVSQRVEQSIDTFKVLSGLWSSRAWLLCWTVNICMTDFLQLL